MTADTRHFSFLHSSDSVLSGHFFPLWEKQKEFFSRKENNRFLTIEEGQVGIGKLMVAETQTPFLSLGAV